MTERPDLPAARPAHFFRPACAAALDIHEACQEVALTAAADPAAAVRQINDIIARRVLGLQLPDDRQIAGWSWPAPPGDTRLPDGALAAAASGELLEIHGRQRFRAGPHADGGAIALVRDKEAANGGYIVALNAAAIRHGEPIFGRDGFRIAEIAITQPQPFTAFEKVDAHRWQSALDRAVLVEELLHAALDYGILHEFSAAAHVHLTTRTRPWQGQALDKATNDPHLVRRYGEYVATRHALEELLAQARGAVAAAGSADDAAHRRQARDAVAAARTFAALAGRAIINGTLELLGAGATSQRYGFDVFWRDFTAHGVTHPPYWPAEVIGRDLVVNLQREKYYE